MKKPKAKILIVDDDAIIQKIYNKIFKDAGYQVRIARNVKETYRQIDKEIPDLILLDIMLGNESGFDILKQIKSDKALESVFVVMISGKLTSFEDQSTGLEMGADGFITRPVENRELLARVEAFMRHKRTQDTLRKMESQYRLLFEKSATGIVQALLSGAITLVNMKICDMLGYSESELLERTLHEITHSDDLPKELELVKTVQSGHRNSFHLEKRLIRKDGAILWVNCHSNVLRDENDHVQFVIYTVSDITEQKRIEDQVKAHITFLDSMIDASPIPIWIADTSGVVIRTNDALCRYLNLSSERIEGKYNILKDQNLIEQGLMPQIVAVFQKKQIARFKIHWIGEKAGDVDFSEARDLWIDATVFPILDENGRLTNVVCKWMDITDKVKAEKNLLKLNETLNVAQDMAKLGYWQYDIESQMPTWSDQMFKVCGFKKEDGEPSYLEHKERWHPDDWETFDKAVQGCMAGTPYNIVVRVWFSDEEAYHFVQTQGFPVYNEQGKIKELFGTSQDITEIKKRESELRELAESHRLLFENAPLGHQLLDSRGHVLRVNEAWLKMLGYSHDEVEGCWFGDFLAPREVDAFKQRFPEFRATGHMQVDVEMVRNDKTMILVHITGHIIYDENGQFKNTHCILRDITIEKQTEALLVQSEERLRALLEQMPSGVAVYEPVDGGNDFIFTEFNSTAEKIENMDRNDVVGKRMTKVFPNVKKFGFFDVFQRVYKTGQSEYYPDAYYDDKKHPVSYRESWVYKLSSGEIVAIYNDITNRKKAEIALQKSEAKYRVLVESLEEGIWQIDAEGFTQYVNPKMAEMLGYDQDEMRGKHLFSFMDERSIGEAKSKLENRKQGKIEQHDFVFQKKNGEPIETLINTSPLIDGEGDYLGSLASIMDITKRKHDEKCLKEAIQKQQEAVRAGNVGLWDWDLKTNKVEYSPEWKKQIGYEEDEISNDFSEWESRVHPDDLNPVLKQIRDNISKAAESYKTEFRFRHKNGQYRWIQATASVVLDKTTGKPVRVRGAHADITEQKLQADQLKQAGESLRDLSEHLYRLQEEERATLARELHDELGQTLTVMQIDLEKVTRKMPKDSELQPTLIGMKTLLKTVDTSLDTIQSRLRPGILDDLGLIAAIDWQLQEHTKRNSFQCRFFHKLDDSRLGPDLSITIYRIVQECVTNIVRHANAKHVTLHLQETKGRIRMEIQDDGKGIRPEDLNKKKSFGIMGLRERVTYCHGTFSIEGTPGKGTTIYVELPVEMGQN